MDMFFITINLSFYHYFLSHGKNTQDVSNISVRTKANKDDKTNNETNNRNDNRYDNKSKSYVVLKLCSLSITLLSIF